MATTRDDGSQQSMWVATADLPQGAGHPFYERLNQILDAAGFDAFVEKLCAPFYARSFRYVGERLGPQSATACLTCALLIVLPQAAAA